MTVLSIISITAAVIGLLFGGNLIVQVTSYFRNQVLRDARDEKVAEAVLGTPNRVGISERMIALSARLKNIEHEMHPNSGGSLRDVVDRVERAIIALDARVSTLEQPAPIVVPVPLPRSDEGRKTDTP